MKVDVTVGGRPWKVDVEGTEQPGLVAVTVKGQRRVVDASWIDAGTLSLVDGPTTRDIRIHARGNGALGVEIRGRLFEAVVSPKRGREGFSDGVAAKNLPVPVSAAVSIKAPMPGRVVRVLVAAGDRVAARQPVVVVEAMKMENELRSPKDGTVREVAVAAGAAVETGALLVVVE